MSIPRAVALVAAALVMIAACDDASTAADAGWQCICFTDAHQRNPNTICEPVDGQGCYALERCTWLRTKEITRCVTEPGSIRIGAPCGVAANGLDHCEKSAVCVEGTCREVCMQQTDGAYNTCSGIAPVDCSPTRMFRDALTALISGNWCYGVCVPRLARTEGFR